MSDAEYLRDVARAKCEAGVSDGDLYLSDEEPLVVDGDDGKPVGHWIKVEVFVSTAETKG